MSALPRRIVLAGFMGAGKSTVARALAARLGCAMLDMDDHIVERAGRSIEAIIDADGEAHFRQIETEALRDILEHGDTRVIALGGGTWTIEANRTLIAAHDCLTVWLDAPFALCWQRIANAPDTARPLARDRNHAHALYDARRAAYELAAWHVRAGEERSAKDLAVE
ncbi:MAG: AAA family ATPase, partial [Acidobacteria bacterium]|nr:AAA family ATPase [Acidobacteriota bacterium]